MSLALLFHYLMLNMFRMLIHPSSGAYDLFVELFHGLFSLVRCLLVLRCGLAVVVWYPDAGWSPHPDTTTPTHIEPEQNNPWNNSTNKSQGPDDGCINIRNMLSIKYWNNKASDIKLFSLYSIIKMMHGPINIRLTICLFIVNTVSLAWLFFRTENHFDVFSRVSFILFVQNIFIRPF